MEIIRKNVGIYSSNSYIVYDKETKEGVIIDVGGNADDLAKIIEDNEIDIKGIFITHGHFDHIAGVEEFKTYIDAPVYVHEKDRELLQEPEKNLSTSLSIPPISFEPDKTFNHGAIFKFGTFQVQAIHVPGHTQGSTTYRIDDNLFTGDTLFRGTIGRSDLYGGNHEQLIKSIITRLITLPDKYKVHPGHGPGSTVANEKKINPFLN